MQKISIAPSEETPQIELEQGRILIKGVFYPENVLSFFAPVNTWLDMYYQSEYFKIKKNATILHLDLPYMNTASRKVIFDVLINLEDFYAQGHNIKILNFYENYSENDVFQIINDADFEIPVEHIKS